MSYGDYTVAEMTISEVDDWPECDEVVRDIALWAVHALPTSGIERNLRAILHKALGQIEEFQADAKDEHAEAMKRMGQGIRQFEFCRGQQRFILGALQQMEMECLAAYEAAEDPAEAQEHFDTGDGVGALVIQFQSALEHADLDADTEQKQEREIRRLEEALETEMVRADDLAAELESADLDADTEQKQTEWGGI